MEAICCIALLRLLHSLNRAEVDEKIFRRMLKDYQNHYSALTASIDTINRRSHDLKYRREYGQVERGVGSWLNFLKRIDQQHLAAALVQDLHHV